MALNIYYDKDADLGRLSGKTVAIIGYGDSDGQKSLGLINQYHIFVVARRKHCRRANKVASCVGINC